MELFKNEFSHVNFCSINPYDMSNIAIVSRTNCTTCPFLQIRAGEQNCLLGRWEGCSWDKREMWEYLHAGWSAVLGADELCSNTEQHPCSSRNEWILGLAQLPLPKTLPEFCHLNAFWRRAPHW